MVHTSVFDLIDFADNGLALVCLNIPRHVSLTTNFMRKPLDGTN